MTITAAAKRLYEYQPETQYEIRTLEIYHPDIGVFRLCTPYSDKTLAIESDAPRNAGESVVFTATALEIREPNEGTGSSVAMYNANFPAAGTDISKLLDSIADTLTPVEFIYRKYISSDLSEPAIDPVHAYVSNVVFNSRQDVTINGTTDNGAIRRTGEIYTLDKFPTLKKL